MASSASEKVHGLVIRSRGHLVVVSCKCRVQPGAPTGREGKSGRRDKPNPMGEAQNFDQSRKLYNNPENHYAPFGAIDKIGQT